MSLPHSEYVFPLSFYLEGAGKGKRKSMDEARAWSHARALGDDNTAAAAAAALMTAAQQAPAGAVSFRVLTAEAFLFFPRHPPDGDLVGGN